MAWIKSQTDWDQYTSKIAPRFEPRLNIPDLHIDHCSLYDELQTLLQIYPQTQWRSQLTGALSGLSLSYNPQAPREEWHCGSFGHPRYRQYKHADYFKAPEQDRVNAVYGDYLDSLSFRCLLPEIKALPQLRDLLNSFRMPVVRCTVRCIDGTQAWPSLPDGAGMHQDGPPWEVLRVNICITGSEDFGLQYVGHAPIVMQPGSNLIVNTDYDHRVWVKQRNMVQRLHLIIGLVPWLDYDAQADTWTINENFGIHPYDLVHHGSLLK